MKEKLLSTLLTEAEKCLMAYWSNLAFVAQCPMNGEYINTVEQACPKDSQDVVELWAEIKGVLKKAHPPKPYINKGEKKAIKQMREDKTRVIWTADKGVAMVVIVM